MELNDNNDSLPNQYPSLDDLIITNQPINDQYINMLHLQLKELKRERKQKEYETNALTNRVNCLRQEEEKTLKQLEQTKIQTNNKIVSIEKQKLKLEQQIKIRERNKRELEYRKKRNKEQRDLMARRYMTKEAKIQNAIIETRMIKEQQKSNEDYLKLLRMKEIDNKKSNNEKIKNQLIINSAKKRTVLLKKKSKIKVDLETKIMLELNIKEENDEKIKQMQIIEEAICKKIQDTTQMHKMCKVIILYNIL